MREMICKSLPLVVGDEVGGLHGLQIQTLGATRLSEEIFQVSSSIHDSDDFYCVYIALVAVGPGFVEDEVRSLDKQTRGWTYVWTSRSKTRVIDEHLSLRLHSVKDALGGGRAVEADVGIDLDQVFAGLRSPEKINWHGPDLP
jgi:hypothetical protein